MWPWTPIVHWSEANPPSAAGPLMIHGPSDLDRSMPHRSSIILPHTPCMATYQYSVKPVLFPCAEIHFSPLLW